MREILITNDDGYESEGLHALIEAIRPLGHVTVVAPSTEKSACGHSLTLTRPMRFIGVDDDFYKLDDGTPSDCIYLALHSLFEERRPDIVLSGINKGANMGEDITYSGTASAAMEAVLHGIPAVAFSQVTPHTDTKAPIYDFTLAARVAAKLTEKILNGGFPLAPRRFLNVNIPHGQRDAAWKITHAGYRLYGNDAHRHHNPRGEEYYWLGLHPLNWQSRESLPYPSMSDFDAIHAGYVSISPIQLDMTAYDDIARLERWLER
ncbi:MAG: 5'/3'-nucleotidase SurE [Campylobacterales bacterium]